MMLSQKILVCVTAAFLWGVAGTPETGEGRKDDERRKQEQIEAYARAAAQQEKQGQREAQTRAFLEQMLRSTEREQLTDIRRRLQQEIQALEQEHLELQMQELNLETELQRQEIAGEHDDVVALQRDLIEIRAQRARRDLEMQRRRSELNHQEERRDIRRMRERLDYVSDWRSVAFDPQEAVMMATQAVVETGLASEDPHKAAETLEELLGEIDDLGSRTAIRFALRDLYTELGRLEKAGEHMKQVVRENARALDAYRGTERR